MNPEFIPESDLSKKIESLDKSELISKWSQSEIKATQQEKTIRYLKSKVSRLNTVIAELRQCNFDLNEGVVIAQEMEFSKSSERSTEEEILEFSNDGLRIPGSGDGDSDPKVVKKRVLKPSERYPNAEVKVVHVVPKNSPKCPCCTEVMQDSGMTEDSEKLSVIPKKFIIELQKRHKFHCTHCHGALATTGLPPAIVPGGAFSDALVLDVALSKFCDLIPISRYVAMAERLGIVGLPAQSLIAGTHELSAIVRPVYRLLRKEVLESKVLHADETPHRMLEGEGEEKESWYHWGFTNKTSAYFDIRDTRSGDVASEFLKDSKCEYLMSDVYSGYSKAVRVVNESRFDQNVARIRNIYCNAHARRYFKKAQKAYLYSVKLFMDSYRSIYFLESQLTALKQKDPDLPDKLILETRAKMVPFFEKMKTQVEAEITKYSSKSSIAKAMNYFLENYEGLTLFTQNTELPIDNNAAERVLRNPVIGRKTWYGTHSRQGAETTAVLFSVIESCRLNRVNPRQYLPALVQAIHCGEKPFTPYAYSKLKELN